MVYNTTSITKINPKYKPMKKIILFLVLTVCSNLSNAQVGIGTATPEGALDVTSTNNGFLPPRIALTSTLDNTSVINPNIPNALVNGTIIYNTASAGTAPDNVTPGYYSWNTNRWERMGNTTKSETASSSTVSAPNITFGQVTTSLTNSTAGTFNASDGVRIINATGFSENITNITCNVRINQERYTQDIDLYLQSPAGQIIELTTDNNNFDNGANNTITFDVTFSNNGTSNINAVTGSANITGTYQPEGSLFTDVITPTITTMGGFAGFSPNGNWTLIIRDDQNGPGNQMFFISYTLNITTPIPTNYRLVSETPIVYKAGHDVIVNTTYSANCSDNEGAVTAITRTTASAGAIGTTAANLSAYTQLSYAADSPIQGVGNYWMNTFNQAVSNGLTDGATYYYQLWVRGNVETPTTSNEQWSMIPMQVQK